MARTYKYQKIKNSIAKMSVKSLVDEFNALVGKHCWTSSRAAHDAALIDAFVKNGIDVSDVYNGTSISFRHYIAYDDDNTKVVLVNK